MSRRNILISGVVVLAALAFAAPAAFSRGPDGANGRGERGGQFMKALDLSPDQVTALKALREESKSDAQATREELAAKRQAIQAQWQSGNPDRATLLGLTSELNALQAQKATDRIDFLFAAKGILTPEQFAKFVKFQGKRGGMHGMRGGQRGGHGQRGGFGEHGGFGQGDGAGKHGGHGQRGGHNGNGAPFTGPPTPGAQGR